MRFRSIQLAESNSDVLSFPVHLSIACILLLLFVSPFLSAQTPPDLDGAVQAHLERGLALGKEGNWGAATRELRKAILLNPNSPEAQLSLGIALYWSDKWEEAVQHIEKAISLRPESNEAYFFLAHSLWKLNHLEEAGQAFHKSLENGLELPRVYDDFGQLRL